MRRAVARLGSLGQPGSWNFTSVSRQSSPRALAKVLLVPSPTWASPRSRSKRSIAARGQR